MKSRMSWTDLNDRIYLRLVSYVTGPKFHGRYALDGLRTGTRDKVVRIGLCSDRAYCRIYIGSRIRISVTLRSANRYYAFQDKATAFPEDTDGYVEIVAGFLREFIRHVNSFDWFYDGHGCPPEFPGSVPSWMDGHVARFDDILLVSYMAVDLDGLDRLTKWMASREFRYARGDYRR